MDRTQFLVDSALVAGTYEIVFWRGVLDARPSFGVLAIVLVLGTLGQTKYLCLGGVSRLLELIVLGHIVRLIQGRALSNACPRPAELGALPKSSPTIRARLGALSSGALANFRVSLRK